MNKLGEHMNKEHTIEDLKKGIEILDGAIEIVQGIIPFSINPYEVENNA